MKKSKIKVIAHFKKVKIESKEFLGTKWIRSETSGLLYYLRNKDSTLPIQFWTRKNNEPIKNLIEIKKITTKHGIDNPLSRGRVSYACPLYCEVISQIPKTLIDKVAAFEVKVNNYKCVDNNLDEITVVLYSLKRNNYI